jgi:two-component system phosphate regulon sensor histidine kinase PhoR
MKFRWKLMLSFMTLVITMAGLFYLLFERTLNGYAIDEAREQLLHQAQLARLMIEHEKSPDIQQTAKTIGDVIKARVTILAPDGRVIGDSGVAREGLSELDNHADRPEIVQAAASGSGTSIRYSNTIHMDMLYTALPFNTTAARGFVRLALPLDSLARIRLKLHGMIGGAIALAVLLSLLLSYLLSRIVFKPLEAISAAAIRIGNGELDLRIPVLGRDEGSELAAVMNVMSGRIREQMQNMAAKKQQLNAILQGMGEGVMVVAVDGTITLVNPAFSSLFALDDGAVGRQLIEVSRHPDLLAAYNEQQLSSGSLLREIVIQPLGQTLLTHWVPLESDGRRQGVVAVFHDISDMKKVENMRRDFVSNVSHELRTPVAVIKGYAETLLDGTLESDPERARRFAEIILGHSERLTALINDILTLSRLEAKGTSLELKALDPAGAVRKAVQLLNEQALARKIDVQVDIPPEVPHVLADPGKLEQVLVNLLDNAVKYTPEGGNVRIFCEDAGNLVRIFIADSGIGIPTKDQQRIFERFYRVDEARSREQGGTGLGLAIVKHIVQLHGGEITVSSSISSGTTFSFTLKKP